MKDLHILTGVGPLLPKATQATVDLNSDLVTGWISFQKGKSQTSLCSLTDLFLTLNSNNKPKFRLHRLPISNMTRILEYDPPEGVALYHLSTFADIGERGNTFPSGRTVLFGLDADGELEHILPVCMDNDCSISQIYVRDNNQVKSKTEISLQQNRIFLVESAPYSIREGCGISFDRSISCPVRSSTREHQNR